MRQEKTCRGGLNLKDYLLDIMQKHEHGLYLCELPTGNGKTYDSAQAMKVFADSVKDNTKIIYLAFDELKIWVDEYFNEYDYFVIRGI